MAVTVAVCAAAFPLIVDEFAVGAFVAPDIRPGALTPWLWSTLTLCVWRPTSVAPVFLLVPAAELYECPWDRFWFELPLVKFPPPVFVLEPLSEREVRFVPLSARALRLAVMADDDVETVLEAEDDLLPSVVVPAKIFELRLGRLNVVDPSPAP